jgi:hypothetical protein
MSEYYTIIYHHALLGQICLESKVVAIYINHDLHTNIDNTLGALGVQYTSLANKEATEPRVPCA